MTTHAFAPVSSAYRILFAVFWMAGLASLSVGSVPARAQVVVGGATTPNVTIDYSVLDELGRAPNVPQVLSGQPPNAPLYPFEFQNQPRFPSVPGSATVAPSERIVLTPPAAIKKRTVRRTPVRPARKQAAKKTPEKKTAEKKTAEKKAASARQTPARQDRPATAKPQPLMPPPPPVIAEAPPRVAPPQPPATKAPASPEKKMAALPPPTPAAAPEPPALPPAAPRVEAKKAPPQQTAKVSPSAPAPRSGSLRRIGFAPGSAKLNAAAAAELKTMAGAMKRDSALRIQLLAYAGQSSDSASQARRLSLSRALAARSQLIEQGVRSTRIDVRALGNKSEGGPADRIDIIVTKR